MRILTTGMAMSLALLLCLAQARAAEVQVIDDFEAGVDEWHRVEGKKAPDAGPLCRMESVGDSKFGRGAARLRYAPCPGTWTHMQRTIGTLDWIVNDCDRVRFWVKGDGSGERLNLMFGNYGIKPPLCFSHGVMLDFVGWHEFTVPFSEFEPKGKMPACIGPLVLAQLNVSNTHKPVDVILDEIVALPAERGGQPPRFFDLSVAPAGGWSDKGPARPIRVDNIKGMPEGATLSRFIHGVANHADLHNPVAFAVRYPDGGTFGVKVAETSGYGGSRLIIKVDGQEKLRRDFPGETQTNLTQYAGYYSVQIPPGEHAIVVDNDGKDWLQVDAYQFGNFRTAGARVRREDARIEVKLMDSTGAPIPGLEVSGDVAGAPLPFEPDAKGAVFLSRDVRGQFPWGTYPVEVTARRGEAVIFQTTCPIRLATPRIRPAKVAYPVGADVDLAILHVNEAGVPMTGKALRLLLDGRTVACREQSNGVYVAPLGRLDAGAYHAKVKSADGRNYDAPFLVYDPSARPWEAEGLIRIGPNGWFQTAQGRPHVPWGYATIGLFSPDPEIIARLPGESAWCRASDEAILNWIGLLASYGVNCVRFGVTVDARSICGDMGGHADPFIVQRLRHFLDLIGPMGVRAVPVMWWGHYRNFGYQGIPAYDALIQKQADWFTKPEALKLQQQYVREVVEPFKDDPRILAWEVMNETYRADKDLDASVKWTNEIIHTIRRVSPRHLITTSAAEATPGPELQWIRGAEVDFFNYHAYPTYPDYNGYRKLAGDSPREMGNYTAMMTLCDRMGPRPSILGETGNDRLREVNYPEFRALITRDCLWLAFLNGSPGGISWDAIADAREFLVISRIAARMDWTRFAPAPAPVAVTVSDADAELPQLAQYTWWSLQNCAPMVFAPPGAKAAPGQQILPGSAFAPPSTVPETPVTVSEGFQAAALLSGDGRTWIVYVRNVAAVPRANVRVRSPKPLTITLRPPRPERIEVWDLDLREVVREVTAQKGARIRLDATAHDYALVLR